MYLVNKQKPRKKPPKGKYNPLYATDFLNQQISDISNFLYTHKTTDKSTKNVL